MRVNIYSEELTEEVQMVETTTPNGNKFLGVRFVLESTNKLHNTPDDDDRSAVTFWLGDRDKAERFFDRAIYEIHHSVLSSDKSAPY